MTKKLLFALLISTGITYQTQAQLQIVEPIQILKKHQASVTTISFNKDGSKMFTGGEDNSLYIWNTKDYVNPTILQGYVRAVRAIISLDSKEMILSTGDNVIKKTDLTGKMVNSYSGNPTDIWSLSITKDGRYLCGGSFDKAARIWDMEKPGNYIASLTGHKKSVLAVSFSPDARYIVTGSLDESIKLWDASNYKELKTFTGHGGNIYELAFLPDGKSFLSVSGDKSIRKWETGKDKSTATILGHEHAVMALDIEKEGNFFVTCSYDKTIRVWEVSTNACIAVLSGHKDVVNDVAINPQSLEIVSVSNDKMVHIWPSLPNIISRHYYGNTIESEKAESGLFDKRRKNEDKEKYEKRVAEGIAFEKQLYQKYYLKYLEKNKKTEVKIYSTPE